MNNDILFYKIKCTHEQSKGHQYNSFIRSLNDTIRPKSRYSRSIPNLYLDIHDNYRTYKEKQRNSLSVTSSNTITNYQNPPTIPNPPKIERQSGIDIYKNHPVFQALYGTNTNMTMNAPPVFFAIGPSAVIPPKTPQSTIPIAKQSHNPPTNTDKKQDEEDKERKSLLDLSMSSIDISVNSIGDLCKVIETCDPKKRYPIDLLSLRKIKGPLNELNEMIGLENIKVEILDQILYYLQELHVVEDSKHFDFLHTCIYGPPGTGKTEVAHIIGKIFASLGVLKGNIFKKVTRSDLIAGYLGQTALKTKKVIDEVMGGVLFIDEVYALGNAEKKDSFSKECIDTLCEALTAHKDKFMVIIAGYEREIKECFFNYNPGLESRFPWTFHTEKYKSKELYKIFTQKIKMIGWKHSFSQEDGEAWFEKNKDNFPYYGRDIEVLLSKVKISHSRNLFNNSLTRTSKMITQEDLEAGFKLYSKNENVKSRMKDRETYEKLKFSLYT